MKNQPKEDQSYVHDPEHFDMPFEQKKGQRGGRGGGIDSPSGGRASEGEYNSAWRGRRSGSKPELRPDIRHA